MNASPKAKISIGSESTRMLTVVKGGSSLPHERLGYGKETLLAAYRDMLLARRFEEKAASLYQQQEIQGFCHLYIGQEAVAIGTKLASKPGDDFITSYRCHVMALACGVPPEQVMAELTGRVTGISKGKGGSMHMFDPSKGFWGGHGIVAAQVPLGAGLAFAAKYKKQDKVCFTFFGDGAFNAGQTFEAMNMAALWKLPVVFIIENNRWGMGTSVPRAAAGNLLDRGRAFGIPSEQVDGMNVLAVAEAITNAAAHARAGNGPCLLEMDTYRLRGHSMSDPAKYRTRQEVEEVEATRGPLVQLRKYLEEHFHIGEDWFSKTDTEVKAEVTAVAASALAAPRPGEEELYTDVMAE